MTVDAYCLLKLLLLIDKATHSIDVVDLDQVFLCMLRQKSARQSESFFHNAGLKAQCLHNL